MVRIRAVWRAGLVAAATLCCAQACGPPERSTSSGKDAACLDPRSLFVNGATRVSAIFQMDLRLPNDDWAELTRLLKAFADSHGLSFRNASLSRPGVVKTLEVRLCAPNKPTIQIVEQRWASNDYLPPIPGRGIGIPFYGDVPPAAWQPLAVELVEMLERRWPNEVRFLNGGGYWIDRPEFLGAHAAEALQ